MQETISIEVQDVLVRGFIQYAFDEMQTDGWDTRRKELIEQFEIEQDGHNDQEQQPTFPALMERHSGDLDKVLHVLFCREIIYLGWFEAYCIQLDANWDKRIANVYCYWTFESVLSNWFFRSALDAQQKGTNGLYELKELLGLNLSLK